MGSTLQKAIVQKQWNNVALHSLLSNKQWSMNKMILNRRQLLKIMAAGSVASLLPKSLSAKNTISPPIKAIAFDAFPVFDPRPIFMLAKQIDPSGVFAKLWFNKIFGYTWLHTSANRYKSFEAIIKDALVFSAQRLKIKLSSENQKQLLSIWVNLKAWPDVKSTLKQLQEQNIRLGFLSNFSEEMLRRNAKNSGIEKQFEFYLSTDQVKLFKPSPAAYQMGVDQLSMPKENIAFTAFAGWDASGASWFGYPTVWVNRLDFPAEKLGTPISQVGRDLSALTKFVAHRNQWKS
ncbi:hypothetical protein MNBD_GAMMA12-3882 [hydrothermal vent metagenome]|uniref:Haloacid dehalogenase, type II n=1 Tax=hydrothermal vent metagenome TaxID=652676 RepID=A0A3B0YF33_9ZZZZ